VLRRRAGTPICTPAVARQGNGAVSMLGAGSAPARWADRLGSLLWGIVGPPDRPILQHVSPAVPSVRSRAFSRIPAAGLFVAGSLVGRVRRLPVIG
jgi:hypothetical protein